MTTVGEEEGASGRGRQLSAIGDTGQMAQAVRRTSSRVHSDAELSSPPWEIPT